MKAVGMHLHITTTTTTISWTEFYLGFEIRGEAIINDIA